MASQVMNDDLLPGPSTGDSVVQCPACQSFSYAGDKYCACCGTPIRRLCGFCGAIVHQPVAFFCSQCGRRLDEEGEKDN